MIISANCGAIKEKKQHEGAREGAGRLALGKTVVYLRLPMEVKKIIENYANKHGLTLSDAAEEIIRA